MFVLLKPFAAVRATLGSPAVRRAAAFYSTEGLNLQVDQTALHLKIQDAFTKAASETLTEVQGRVIPEMLTTSNGVLVRAKTGTGKTYAFGLPVINEWLSDKNFGKQESVHTVVINPTRDLAFQTQRALDKVWKDAAPRNNRRGIDLCVGQMKYDQIRRGVNGRFKSAALVATPGRLLDMLESDQSFAKSFKDLRHFVIDEADVLCAHDFKEALLAIVSRIKENHQDPSLLKVTMFSATMDSNTKELARKLMGENYKYIDVSSGPEVTDSVNQSLVTTNSLFESFAVALKLVIEKLDATNGKVIVFMPNIKTTDFFYCLAKEVIDEYYGRKAEVYTLHGDLSQGARNRNQVRFRSARKGVLVSSNVGARGMDFPGVNSVIQLGVQYETASHTHRVGRTGRAGTTGESISILTEHEMFYAERLKKEGHEFEILEKPEITPEFEKQMISVLRDIPSDINQMVTSLLGSYGSVPRIEKDGDPKSLALDCGDLYQKFMGEGNLPSVKAVDLDRFRVSSRDAEGVFNVRGNLRKGFNSGGYNNRGHRNFGDRTEGSYKPRRSGNGYGGNFERKNFGNRRWDRNNKF
ncbi:hypothetical protein KL938_002090 [Ogataea parapolymorpha]|nr:hypothetical protein KL938_002090 [Ogataea parapolymorpha]